MERRFYTLDVFTTTRFEGNPLAVITDGDGLSDEAMLAIAREMNLSETVFVQKPTEDSALARLRIFTTQEELKLAGHPVIGTWFLLAELGVVPAQEGGVHVSAANRRRRSAGRNPLQRRSPPARHDDADGSEVSTRQAQQKSTRRGARPRDKRSRSQTRARIRLHRHFQSSWCRSKIAPRSRKSK